MNVQIKYFGACALVAALPWAFVVLIVVPAASRPAAPDAAKSVSETSMDRLAAETDAVVQRIRFEQSAAQARASERYESATGYAALDPHDGTFVFTRGAWQTIPASKLSSAVDQSADPAVVADVAVRSMRLLAQDRPDQSQHLAAVPDDDTADPVSAILEFASGIPGAGASIIGSRGGLELLLSTGNQPAYGAAVGNVFASLALPVDPSAAHATATTALSRRAELIVIKTLATERHAPVAAAVHAGLVTMTAYLFPDFIESRHAVDPSYFDAGGPRFDEADVRGYLSFMASTESDDIQLLAAAQAYTDLWVRAAAGLDEADSSQATSAISADCGWLQGLLMKLLIDIVYPLTPK